MVGQRFVQLLDNHPWFEVVTVAASVRSAGKSYAEAVDGRWVMPTPVPKHIGALDVQVASDLEKVSGTVDFVVCAVDMPKDQIRDLEERYARTETPVVSNNSAHRWTEDVPVLIPEINPHHIEVIPAQRKKRGWDKGLIVVKPNCSLQSYLPQVFALQNAGHPVESMIVTTLQAVSGAGYPGPASIDMLHFLALAIGRHL